MSKEFVPPRFNLREDTHEPVSPFAYPIDAAAVQKDQYEVRLHVTETYKELRIRMYVTDPPSIKAMAGGTFTQKSEGDDIVVVLDMKGSFTSAAFLSRFGDEQALANIWFVNWIMANRIPRRIYYRNVRLNWEDQASVPPENRKLAGEHLGTPQLYQPPEIVRKSFYWIGIRVEYDDSTKDAPRYMYPIEFFNLLFWQEEHDPIFAITKAKPKEKEKDKVQPAPEIPPPYEHPLLQKLSESTAHLGAGDAQSDDWLGLRPPLRTYKRLLWEAKREHQYNHDNWKSGGSVASVLQNPILHKGGQGYKGFSKCNVFAADIAFRAGFRYLYRTISLKKNTVYYRKSVYPTQWTRVCKTMQAAFIQKKQGRVFRVTIDPNTNMVTPTADGDIIGETYSIPKDKDGRARSSHAVGRCRDVTDANKEMWNKAIARGLVLLYARNSYFNGKEDVVRHVVIVTKIVRITDTNIVADVIDQNCDDASDTPRRCGVGYCGRENTETGRFIELVPAGDPTEPWGIFDLNSIRMMTQSEKDELANEGKK